MKPPSQDTPRRRPVWEALSELFLDTQLEERHLLHIASVIVDSHYTDDEVASILYNEVYPVCIGNLRCMVGEWNGFDCDWLQGQILRRAKVPWTGWWPFRCGRKMIHADWQKVLAYVQEARSRVSLPDDKPAKS